MIDTALGPILGRRFEGADVFRGIPYAQPPVGGLRFRPPEPPAAWTKPLDASAFGPISLQDADPLPMAVPGAERNFYHFGARTSEDCLTLNIWAPQTPGPHPVLVWIHGGAFLCGSGTGEWTDGTVFATRHDVLVVTLNYRLGLLGWLDLSDYAPDSVNLGLQDQIAALHWVRDHIASFGGDPERVTIAGESAGAMSVCALLASPSAKGLFARAIVESGSTAVFQTHSAARATTATVLRELCLSGEPEPLPALASVSALRIQEARRRIAGFIPAPVIDGKLIPPDPHARAVGAVLAGVDLLIGSNAAENKLFAVTGWGKPLDSREGFDHRLAALLPADTTGNARAKVAELYADQLAADPQQAWDAICTHHDWTAPAHRFAADASNGSGLVFSYEFARPSDALCGKVGAAHLIEVPYAFGNLAAAGAADLLGATSQTEEAQRLSEAMNGYWAAFIATGNPATVGVPSWPAYSAAERTVMVFDSAAHPVRHHLAPQVDFWTECVDISTPPLTAVGIQ